MGVLSNNEATKGGGVYTERGSIKLLGGEISNNKATDLGGGVCIDSIFKMYSGTISGNTASSGGGVYIGRAILIYQAEESDNTAIIGGGVYNNDGAFSKSGGEISATLLTLEMMCMNNNNQKELVNCWY